MPSSTACSSATQRSIQSIEQFVAMRNKDRRSLVRSLSDDEYLDMMAFCNGFPRIDIEAETQGMAREGAGHACML